MEYTFRGNTSAIISGKIVSAPVYSHTVYGESFYSFFIETPRTRGVIDKIPTLVSERIHPISELKLGVIVLIDGQFRSRNNLPTSIKKLDLTVFALSLKILSTELHSKEANKVNIKGYIAKPPVYRKTPKGKEITDIVLAVNRAYLKSDYIPTILWERNAKYGARLSVGDCIEVVGRIQSREYEKLVNDTYIKITAYELSVSHMTVISSELKGEINEPYTYYYTPTKQYTEDV